jgi:uncharacterized protein YbjT (DUF2867 family)
MALSPLNVVIFGATGMIGHGTLLECLEAPSIQRIVIIVRRSMNITNEKVQEIIHNDFTDYTSIEDQLKNLDACFFCLGISSAGMNEEEYRRITYDFPLAAAKTLLRLNPNLTFCHVTGVGTDSSEQGRIMWARVKGKSENDLLALTESAWMFRPGVIKPEKGVVSASKWVRRLYTITKPIAPVVKAIFPNSMTSTSIFGRAMINVVRQRPAKKILTTSDINQLGAASN